MRRYRSRWTPKSLPSCARSLDHGACRPLSTQRCASSSRRIGCNTCWTSWTRSSAPSPRPSRVRSMPSHGPPCMARLILDSGAIIALAAGNERARCFVQRAVRERILAVIPAVVIAETTRGGARDAAVNRVIKAVDEVALVTEAVAREAGRLLARARVANATIDALV